MAIVCDDLRCHVLGRTAESIGASPRLYFLDKAKVSQLHISVVLEKDILWLQITVDQIH